MKKIAKKLFSMTMILVIMLTYVFPLKDVVANDTHGEGDNFIKMGINVVDAYTIESATINAFDWVVDDEYHSTNDQYHIIIVVSENETTGDVDPDLYYGGNWNNYATKSVTHEGNTHTFVIDLNDTDHQGFLGLTLKKQEVDPNQGQGQNPGEDPGQGQGQDPGQGQGQGENPNQGEQPVGSQTFDGKAYLIWSCKSGGVCYAYKENIPDFNNGVSTFYKASEMVDARTGEAFDVDAQYKGWALVESFDRWIEDYRVYNNITGAIDWSKVDPKDMIGDPINMGQYEQDAIAHGCSKDGNPEDVFRDCVDNYVLTNKVAFPSRAQLQPLGEPQYENAYVSYGDRNFKVVVYNDEYKGISYGNLSNLNYYPSQWANAYLMRDHFDVSGTTKDKPTPIPAILLESTLNIKALGYNGYEITKLEALDVPEGAVTVTKAGDEWKLEFSSNFYDKVVFKATDNNGGVSYFRVDRYTIDGWIRGEGDHGVITVDFFYDNNPVLGYNHDSFDLTAKILYKDGTTKNVKLEAVKRIDDGMGNITREYEVDEEHPPQEYGPAGKGLIRSVYEYTLAQGEDQKIQDIYINAEFKGSTATNYAGAFSGSGKGVLANIYHGEE